MTSRNETLALIHCKVEYAAAVHCHDNALSLSACHFIRLASQRHLRHSRMLTMLDLNFRLCPSMADMMRSVLVIVYIPENRTRLLIGQ